MRLGYIQDIHPFAEGGGAELNDATHIIEGIRRGHDIQVMVGAHGVEDMSTVPFDGFIVSNCRSIPQKVFDNFVANGVPFVMFLHDYDCRYRLLFPMQDKCQSCFTRDRWLPVHQAARLRIWLSPLHRDSWLWVYPELRDLPHILVPSAIRDDLFFDQGHERRGTIAVHSHIVFKGRYNFHRWAVEHPDEPITLVGTDDASGMPPNVKAVGRVPYFKLNDLYNQHETFLHLPAHPQPFERTCAEAYMAGCRIIGNQLVGALSWEGLFEKGPEGVREACGTAPTRFWDAVEEALR